MIPNRVDWLLLAPAGLALGIAAWNVVAWPAIGNRRLTRPGEVSVSFQPETKRTISRPASRRC